jgi:nucleoside-diphosphate-sugar epimerase
MKILVTGATGRVGSRLVPHLLKRGDAVRILVRDQERAQSLYQKGAEIVIGDLEEPSTLTQAVAGMDAVIHLAAFFRGATPEEAQAINMKGTLALAQAALKANVSRFIFTSTNLVYGPNRGRSFLEDDAPAPEQPYPASKAAAEQALMELHRNDGLGLRILRLAFVYGEKDPHLSEGMQWFRKWNPNQLIHMVHHEDVAQAVMLAADEQGIDGQIYNVADNEPVAAEEILQLFEEKYPEDAAGRPMDEQWQGIMDTMKIHRDLGFQPIYPALRKAVESGVL